MNIVVIGGTGLVGSKTVSICVGAATRPSRLAVSARVPHMNYTETTLKIRLSL